MKLATQLQRRQRFEEDYFRLVDRNLHDRLATRIRRADRVESLRRATGVRDEGVLEELADLEVDADSLTALSLYPVVLVAWADGRLDGAERREILDAAVAVGCVPGTPSHALLSKWIAREPSPRLHQAWRAYVRSVCSSSSPAAREAIRDASLLRARLVAAASGGSLGFNPISPAECDVLHEVAAAFEDEEE